MRKTNPFSETASTGRVVLDLGDGTVLDTDRQKSAWQKYADDKDTANRSAWATADTQVLTDAKGYTDSQKYSQALPIPTSTDPDTLTTDGMYKLTNYFDEALRVKAPHPYFRGAFEVNRLSAAGVLQIATEWHYTTPHVYWRSYVSGTWYPWTRALDTADRQSIIDEAVAAANTAVAGKTADVVPARKNRVIVSDMSGWVAGPATQASYNLAVADPVVGATSASVTVTTASGNGYIDKTGLNFSLKDRSLVLWVKATGMDGISSVVLKVSSNDTFGAAFGTALPLLSGGKSPVKEGEWFPLHINPGSFYVNNGVPNLESLTAIRVQPIRNSGTVVPTLTVGGVATYQERHPDYRGAVVSFAFDDTWASHATLAAPYLAKYGFPGTEYLVASRVGTAGNLSMADLHRLREVHGWEIAAHASNDAAHTDWTLQTDAWVEAELQAQKDWQAANNFPTRTFAYPIGPFTSTHARMTRKHYDSARSTYGWTNSVWDPHKHRLSCYVVNAASTVSSIQTTIDRAKANGGWVVLMFHHIVDGTATGNDVTLANFKAIVDAVNASGLPVATVGDVIAGTR